MTVPTNVRVESTSITTTTLNWTNTDTTNLIDVYRSTDGVSFSKITTLAAQTVTFTDTGLSPGTQYFYKLTYDGGATFSSVVDVVTQSCVEASDSNFILPRFGGTEQESDKLDELAQRIEDVLGGRLLMADECPVCPIDGAIIIDCSKDCTHFVVIADQDINSISLHTCDSIQNMDMEFVIPPNTTRKICGFPASLGFTGDECFNAPIAAGAEGRTVKLGLGNGKLSPNSGQSKRGVGPVSGGGSGGQTCTCVPSPSNALTIKCCTANCSIQCSTTKSLTLKACGGIAPYTWSGTGSLQFDRTSGSQVTVTPPANTGSGVAGLAYKVFFSWHLNSGGLCANCPPRPCEGYTDFGCNDASQGCTAGTGADRTSQGCGSSTVVFCSGPQTCQVLGAPPNVAAFASNAAACTSCSGSGGTPCDKRTAPMIAAGCNPCGLSAAGQTVTVTDATGTSVSVVLRV